MHSRHLFLMALLISAGQSAALARSELATPYFTIQVASFPDSALGDRFAARLVSAGERPVCHTVEIGGRGYWTRVFVGLFNTTDAARRHGETLVARGIIKEFLVKKADSIQALTRPRRVNGGETQVALSTATPLLKAKTVAAPAVRIGDSSHVGNPPAPGAGGDLVPASKLGAKGDPVGIGLPVVESNAIRFMCPVDTSLIPRPDPVELAFSLVTGEVRSGPDDSRQQGGLWIGGDTAEGLVRLRWIVGDDDLGLIELEADGRVRLDKRLVAKAAGLEESRVEDPMRAVNYISSNEGLLLLVQITQGRYRYLLHIGRQAPTSGKNVEVAGSINLDNNPDSRINPYRKDFRKLDGERPPEGYDSLIGLNPVARWFNLSTNSWVQAGEIVFHELAEAYAKLELGLDYLDHGTRTGAHALALKREWRLKSQRPGADIVITTGSNRLLRTEQEIRLFYAEAGAGVSQR